MGRELEIYVHIPFCARKCGYCDFLSFRSDEDGKRSYIDALAKEIRASKVSAAYEVSSVFIGGGTPSLLTAEQITGIMEVLADNFRIRPGAEISMEANPGTVDLRKLSLCLEAGINRISFGCQAVQDHLLKKLGRIHTFAEFLEGYKAARSAGFDNINVDLMSGLPGQSCEDWEESLRIISGLEPEHVSAYSLILEEGTPFFENAGSLELPDEESERLMYENTHEILEGFGYRQYEISNYAKPGYECVHNVGYWRRRPYLGFGIGAASLFEECRYVNTRDMEEYLRNSTNPKSIREDMECLSKREQMDETVILGLRMCQGVSDACFQKTYGKSLEQVYGPVIDKYRREELLQWREGCLSLTRRGISLSNVVMAEFLE